MKDRRCPQRYRHIPTSSRLCPPDLNADFYLRGHSVDPRPSLISTNQRPAASRHALWVRPGSYVTALRLSRPTLSSTALATMAYAGVVVICSLCSSSPSSFRWWSRDDSSSTPSSSSSHKALLSTTDRSAEVTGSSSNSMNGGSSPVVAKTAGGGMMKTTTTSSIFVGVAGGVGGGDGGGGDKERGRERGGAGVSIYAAVCACIAEGLEQFFPRGRRWRQYDVMGDAGSRACDDVMRDAGSRACDDVMGDAGSRACDDVMENAGSRACDGVMGNAGSRACDDVMGDAGSRACDDVMGDAGSRACNNVMDITTAIVTSCLYPWTSSGGRPVGCQPTTTTSSNATTATPTTTATTATTPTTTSACRSPRDRSCQEETTRSKSSQTAGGPQICPSGDRETGCGSNPCPGKLGPQLRVGTSGFETSGLYQKPGLPFHRACTEQVSEGQPFCTKMASLDFPEKVTRNYETSKARAHTTSSDAGLSFLAEEGRESLLGPPEGGEGRDNGMSSFFGALDWRDADFCVVNEFLVYSPTGDVGLTMSNPRAQGEKTTEDSGTSLGRLRMSETHREKKHSEAACDRVSTTRRIDEKSTSDTPRNCRSSDSSDAKHWASSGRSSDSSNAKHWASSGRSSDSSDAKHWASSGRSSDSSEAKGRTNGKSLEAVSNLSSSVGETSRSSSIVVTDTRAVKVDSSVTPLLPVHLVSLLILPELCV